MGSSQRLAQIRTFPVPRQTREEAEPCTEDSHYLPASTGVRSLGDRLPGLTVKVNFLVPWFPQECNRHNRVVTPKVRMRTAGVGGAQGGEGHSSTGVKPGQQPHITLLWSQLTAGTLQTWRGVCAQGPLPMWSELLDLPQTLTPVPTLVPPSSERGNYDARETGRREQRGQHSCSHQLCHSSSCGC